MLPELRTAQLFLGIGDGACANIGSKCLTGSRIAVTIGTSAAAWVCLRSGLSSSIITVPNGLFCYRVDKSHILVGGGALTDGGSVIE
jgi:gluconokinase